MVQAAQQSSLTAAFLACEPSHMPGGPLGSEPPTSTNGRISNVVHTHRTRPDSGAVGCWSGLPALQPHPRGSELQRTSRTTKQPLGWSTGLGHSTSSDMDMTYATLVRFVKANCHRRDLASGQMLRTYNFMLDHAVLSPDGSNGNLATSSRRASTSTSSR